VTTGSIPYLSRNDFDRIAAAVLSSLGRSLLRTPQSLNVNHSAEQRLGALKKSYVQQYYQSTGTLYAFMDRIYMQRKSEQLISILFITLEIFRQAAQIRLNQLVYLKIKKINTS
jgi:hypothetical protein